MNCTRTMVIDMKTSASKAKTTVKKSSTKKTASSKPTKSQNDILENVPYVNQEKGYYNFSTKTYEHTDWPLTTLGNGIVYNYECLLCSTQMGLSYLDGNLLELDKESRSMYATGGGAQDWDFRKTVANLGYKYNFVSSQQEVDSALEEGRPVIAHIKGVLNGKDYSDLKHFVLIIGKQKDGKYCISDPASENNSYLMNSKTFEWREIDDIAVYKDYSGAGYPDMKYIILSR